MLLSLGQVERESKLGEQNTQYTAVKRDSVYCPYIRYHACCFALTSGYVNENGNTPGSSLVETPLTMSGA
jgi:hypothetical protein